MTDEQVRRYWQKGGDPWQLVPDVSGCYHMRSPDRLVSVPYPLTVLADDDDWWKPGRSLSWRVITPPGCQQHVVSELVARGFRYSGRNRNDRQVDLHETPRPAFIDTGIVCCDTLFARCDRYSKGHDPFVERKLALRGVENPREIFRSVLPPMWLEVPYDSADGKHFVFVCEDLLAVLSVRGSLLAYQVCVSNEDLEEELSELLAGYQGMPAVERPDIFTDEWLAGGWHGEKPKGQVEAVLRGLSEVLNVYSPSLLQAVARILLLAPLPVVAAVDRITTMFPRAERSTIMAVINW